MHDTNKDNHKIDKHNCWLLLLKTPLSSDIWLALGIQLNGMKAINWIKLKLLLM